MQTPYKGLKRSTKPIKRKSCTLCSSPAFSGGLCNYHNNLAKSQLIEVTPRSVGKTARAKAWVKKPTGEADLFKCLFIERGMKCQITGKPLLFDVNSFAHILGKGAWPSFRLNPNNILMVLPEIHHLYDNSSREKLLAKYPEAEIIYTMKDKLRALYNEKGGDF